MTQREGHPPPGVAPEYIDFALFPGLFNELEIFRIGWGKRLMDYMKNREILSVRKQRQTT